MKMRRILLPLLLGVGVISMAACQEGEPTGTGGQDIDPITGLPNTVNPSGDNGGNSGGNNSKDDGDDAIDWSKEKLGEAMVDPTNDNYRVFYEIVPVSFADSNGDKVGDLKGIINSLDYLNDGDINSGKSLGIQGIWLTPVHPSPSYHKYDVTDYYGIDSSLGTLEDYEKLLEECHKRNVSVIMDLVINHTSLTNQWYLNFKKAHQEENTGSEFYDWYSWVPKTEQKSDIHYIGIGGTNHLCESNFGDSMPELNYDNPAVYNEMVNVAKYWIDKGVDGFRFDAAKYIYYNDEVRSTAFWDRYCGDIKAYGKTLGKDIYTVAEVYDSSPAATLPYNTSTNTFNFAMADSGGIINQVVQELYDCNTFTNNVVSFVTQAKAKAEAKNEDRMLVPFISNHDMDRSSGYLWKNGQAQMAANLYILCTGSPFIYYGEEIGLKGLRGTANTDANRRLHMRWGNYLPEGTTECKDPTGSTYEESKQTNGTVESQINSKKSLLTYYRHLIQLRLKYPAIARGTYTAISSGNAAGFKIVYNDETIGILHNTTSSAVTVDLSTLNYSQLLDYIGMGECKLEGTKLTIAAQTSVIIK